MVTCSCVVAATGISKAKYRLASVTVVLAGFGVVPEPAIDHETVAFGTEMAVRYGYVSCP